MSVKKEEIQNSLEEYVTAIVAKTTNLINSQVYNDKGLPIGETFIGKHQTQPFLTVGVNKYYVREKPFNSLSAAAKFITGRETNGWTFWETWENETVDSVYRRK